MNKRTLGALIALNVVLLVAIFVTALTPQPAKAQVGLGKAQYLMVSGDVTGRAQQAAVYVIEVNSSNMVAVFFNGSNGKIELMGSRSLAQDLTGN